MNTYEKIRTLRKQKGLSQAELAKLTGYSDRSSIAKIESGNVDLSESKILLFAKALDVSPSFLMGLDDLPGSMQIGDIGKVTMQQQLFASPPVSDEDIKFALFGGKVSDEAFEEVKRFAAFVKQKEQEKGN